MSFFVLRSWRGEFSLMLCRARNLSYFFCLKKRYFQKSEQIPHGKKFHSWEKSSTAQVGLSTSDAFINNIFGRWVTGAGIR